MKPASPVRYRPSAGPLHPAHPADSAHAAHPAHDTPPRRDADGAPMRAFPAHSLLGASLPARLALAAGALALLWTTVLWALH